MHWILAALAVSLGVGPTFAAETLPPDTMVLFWAPWCAPCRAEIAAFDTLSTTALPRTTIVVAIDADSRRRLLLDRISRDRLRFSEEPLPLLFRRFKIEGPVALPLSAMTDAKGRICATIRGGATTAAIASAKRECTEAAKRPG